MMNQTVLVGRIANDPELIETENGKKYTKVTMAVPRSYKNEEGVYETDFIDCKLWQNVAQSTVEYCRKGDMIGIKGRVQENNYEDKDGKKHSGLDVIAEKVTFLSSKSDMEKRKEDKEEKNDSKDNKKKKDQKESR